jgi:hypothetical protein
VKELRVCGYRPNLRGGSVQGVELKLGQKMGVDWKLSTDSSPDHGAAVLL